ncbi:MAG: hypothetical protein PHI83_01850 [Sphaerochaetaceae bacterium]|jgi:hypothetical protein|nr:hypothetical protein [Sphaerochaetaceae bacterium]
MKKKILLCLLLALLSAMAFAQSPYYEIGDQVFNVEAGTQIPAFLWFPYASQDSFLVGSQTRMSVGGWGSISYSAFSTPYISLGGELGYGFSFSNAGLIFATVPISLRATYIPIQNGTFDLAITANVGGAFNSYDSDMFFGPFASLSVCPSYYFDKNWGIGLKAGMSLTGEFYTASSSRQQYTAACALVPISFSLSYRH